MRVISEVLAEYGPLFFTSAIKEDDKRQADLISQQELAEYDSGRKF